MTGWPSFLAMTLLNRRALVSVGPPGGKGTTRVMGLAGKPSAAAGTAGPRASAAVAVSANTARSATGIAGKFDMPRLLSLCLGNDGLGWADALFQRSVLNT